MKILDVARDLARSSGEIIRTYMDKEKGARPKSCINDTVTDIDIKVDRHSISFIARNFPGHFIITEESGGAGIDSDNLWVVDPIDGTNNYARNFPFFVFSAAFYHRGKPKVGVVYDPMKREMFHAVAGEGAYLNDEIIRVSKIDELRKSFVISGMLHKKGSSVGNARIVSRIADNTSNLRITGCGALDICYVAKGTADGSYHPALKPWDYAAAGLILQEAGGQITGAQGESFGLSLKEVIATNGKIHKELIALLGK